MYWWSRFGKFSPGVSILPHMGEVIVSYRQKRGRYKTQKDLSIAAGVSERTAQEWEATMYIESLERRILLARLLKIPPALLGLDWRLIVYRDNAGNYTNPLDHLVEITEEDSYYVYEDILMMGYELLQKGGPSQIADRLNRRLRRLKNLSENASEADKEAWQDLLCRYYLLLATFDRHRMHMNEALEKANAAVTLATELADSELLALSLYRRTRVFIDLDKMEEARRDIAEAFKYIDCEQVNAALKGNIYLTAAEVNIPIVKGNQELEEQIKQWHEKVFTLLRKGGITDEHTFLTLNVSASHHEKAKTLLQLYLFHKEEAQSKNALRDVRREMNTAWSTLNPDFTEWRMYYLLTDARICLYEDDVEGSAKIALDALKTARFLHSQKGAMQVEGIYRALSQRKEPGPYVDNLGIELGAF